MVKPHLPTPLFSLEQMIEAAYQHFRKTGFPYPELPLHVAMQQMNKLASAKNFQAITNTNLCNRIPDPYNRHRFAVPIQRGKNEQITVLGIYEDDRLLRRAIMKELTLSGKLGAGFFPCLAFINGTQLASNFRPGYSMSMYRRFCKPGSTVIDPSFGFGGRVLGAIASGVVKRYIGFDPSLASYNAQRRMLKDLGYRHLAKLHNIPYEDSTDEHCPPGTAHFAMTSPPYWCKEHYSKDKGQSYLRYPEIERWESGFLLPFFQRTFSYLKRGKFFVVCIANVLILNKNRPLVQMALDCAEQAGFVHYDTEHYSMNLNKSGFTGKKERVDDPPEKVLIFRKPVPGETGPELAEVRKRFDKRRHGTPSVEAIEGFF